MCVFLILFLFHDPLTKSQVPVMFNTASLEMISSQWLRGKMADLRC